MDLVISCAHCEVSDNPCNCYHPACLYDCCHSPSYIYVVEVRLVYFICCQWLCSTYIHFRFGIYMLPQQDWHPLGLKSLLINTHFAFLIGNSGILLTSLLFVTSHVACTPKHQWNAGTLKYRTGMQAEPWDTTYIASLSYSIWLVPGCLRRKPVVFSGPCTILTLHPIE